MGTHLPGKRKLYGDEGPPEVLARAHLDPKKRAALGALVEAQNNRLIMEAILAEGSTWELDEIARKTGLTPARVRAAFADPVLQDALVRHVYSEFVEAAKDSAARLAAIATDPDVPLTHRIAVDKWIVQRHDHLLLMIRQSRQHLNKAQKRVDRDIEEQIQSVLDRRAKRLTEHRKVFDGKASNGHETEGSVGLPVPDGREPATAAGDTEGDLPDLPVSEQEAD